MEHAYDFDIFSRVYTIRIRYMLLMFRDDLFYFSMKFVCIE